MRDWDHRDEIKAVLAEHLETRPTQAWLDVLEPADVWCAEVLDWDAILAHPQLDGLDVLQTVERSSGTTYRTTVCPIRIDGHKATSSLGSNALGEHNARIDAEFGLRRPLSADTVR